MHTPSTDAVTFSSLAALPPPPHLSPEQLQSMKRQREGCIERFMGFAREHGLLVRDCDGRRPVDCVPPGTLLELAALLQIEAWHQSGLGSLLGNAIPTVAVADQDFQQRATQGPDAFVHPRPWPLIWTVLDVWHDRLAANGPDILGADVVLSDLDEDDLIEAVAHLLWDNRIGTDQDIRPVAAQGANPDEPS